MVGCPDSEENEEPSVSSPTVATETPSIAVGETSTVTVTGLDDSQAYRVTLVVADNLTPGASGTGTFVDNDANGAADAGASENVALITSVNSVDQTGAKTVPAATDDPANPSGVFPSGGTITLEVTGVGAGTIYPVAYTNQGASTFLEITDGVPTEPYGVGGSLTVTVPQAPTPMVAPGTETTIEAGETTTYTITGLDDSQAYRVTLVVADNLTPGASGTGTFVDNDANGAADAGASENVALITSVNSVDQTGAKTVPAATDDPANPSGVFPSGGTITLEVTGVGAGTIYPVAYTNQGASTFLEITDGAPTEPYGVGGSLTVTAPPAPTPMVAPSTETTIEAGETTTYTITGLDDSQAYRVTLVVADNLTPGSGGTGTFVDNDANGAADAGASENVALITSVNSVTQTGAKTVPAGTDDPANPSGVFPSGGTITLEVTGVGAGTIYPVAYTNQGASTFLEITDGAPTEPYGVGGSLTVTAPQAPTPMVAPGTETTIEAGETTTYTITGLDDSQAYRVTLVVADNLTPGSGGTGTFVDNDANGAADAGASENVALITSVNSVTQTGAKTVPAGTDDPANPSGVFPSGGTITLEVTGVGAGTIYPVAYTNQGASTFLEITDGVPTESYGVGGSLTVTAPQAPTPMVAPSTETTIEAGETTTYTITGLDDSQAYRVTLVVADNLTPGASGTGTFVDNDANGAADAGASENVALITSVNSVAQAGAKTVPAGTDDPADPSGIFPVSGTITLEVTGMGAGTIYPVAYTNQGASTFLEITDGAPTEPYGVGGSLTVTVPPIPVVMPSTETTIEAGETTTYTITGLDDSQAYRVTLVVADNLTPGASGTGTFVDNDANGAADAGASENVALITSVNSVAQAGAKTVPAGTDDPADPSGIFPVSGTITLEVTGVGAGTIYPVAYTNQGASTFLEITDGAPIEPYGVGGSLTVQPAIAPLTAMTAGLADTRTYTITGLADTDAYRVTLVVDSNVVVDGLSATFVDNDANGAADAGASEQTALITAVNGSPIAGAKTFPAGSDDPADPSGIFPTGGMITVTVSAVGAGSIRPVAYRNGGASTFLELDDGGMPIEPFAVGGVFTVDPAIGAPAFDPASETSSAIGVGGSLSHTISGLDDSVAYRITLVVADNVTTSGDGTGMFVDGDANGAADAGPSETIALITMVNGAAVTPAKTVPTGSDDPAAPSGVFPTGGEITVTITGQRAGAVYPVAYRNGGASTFLELGPNGMPIEPYAIGGQVLVQPTAQPAIATVVGVGGERQYEFSNLDDASPYRITLVTQANVTLDGLGGATFVDLDANGTADAGASELVANIVAVNGTPIVPAKTTPASTDVEAPDAVVPLQGRITVTIAGVAAGSVVPVLYRNGGQSTFLEVDETGAPREVYAVGGSLTVLPLAQPMVDPQPRTVGIGETVAYTVSGLDDAQAYRVTLVVAGNLSLAADGSATFADEDLNGAADAGSSENIGLITMVNGAAQAGAKTVPAGSDDPASPSGIFPAGGQLTFEVTGQAAGAIVPVVYRNGGASTFLEVDDNGAPTELHATFGPLIVQPDVQPSMPTAAAIGDETTYTISGLDDAEAYRITLVVDENVVVAPDGSATFVDADGNGAADAGASETVALITAVNGAAVTAAKTVPAGSDDPSNPSGVFPIGGQIEVTITGNTAGAVRPVAYRNAGLSTFLEIDAEGRPIEPYGVGGALLVGPNGTPVGSTTIIGSGTRTYSVEGLNDGQAYRITLVVAENVSPDGNGVPVFVDDDSSGTADAGASEGRALITMINGAAVTPAKTVPSGADDPADPSGIYPTGGMITFEIEGVGIGAVTPVIYENGGMSTFLEVTPTGYAIEPHAALGTTTFISP